MIALANQMLDNIEEFPYPQLSMDDLPFLNIQDEIDGIEVKLEEPLINELAFDQMADALPAERPKPKQVQQIRKDLLRYDKRTQRARPRRKAGLAEDHLMKEEEEDLVLNMKNLILNNGSVEKLINEQSFQGDASTFANSTLVQPR